MGEAARSVRSATSLRKKSRTRAVITTCPEYILSSPTALHRLHALTPYYSGKSQKLSQTETATLTVALQNVIRLLQPFGLSGGEP